MVTYLVFYITVHGRSWPQIVTLFPKTLKIGIFNTFFLLCHYCQYEFYLKNMHVSSEIDLQVLGQTFDFWQKFLRVVLAVKKRPKLPSRLRMALNSVEMFFSRRAIRILLTTTLITLWTGSPVYFKNICKFRNSETQKKYFNNPNFVILNKIFLRPPNCRRKHFEQFKCSIGKQ